MGVLETSEQFRDQRFDRRSFRTFGRKFKPLPEPSVSYSVLSGVQIGLPNNQPPPPAQTFAKIGKKKAAKIQKQKAPSPPSVPSNFDKIQKKKNTKCAKKRAPTPPSGLPKLSKLRTPCRKAPAPPTHTSIIKKGATIRPTASAAQNPARFVSQELMPYHESEVI